MTLITSLPSDQPNDAAPGSRCSFIDAELIFEESRAVERRHNRRSCCFRGSDGNTYEGFLSLCVFFFKQRLVGLLFSGVFTSPPAERPSCDLCAE